MVLIVRCRSPRECVPGPFRTPRVVTLPAVDAIIGQSVTLPCWVVDVDPTITSSPRFIWYADGGAVLVNCTDSQRSFSAGKYAFARDHRSCNLTVRQLGLSDEGRYECEGSTVATLALMNESLLEVQGKFERPMQTIAASL